MVRVRHDGDGRVKRERSEEIEFKGNNSKERTGEGIDRVGDPRIRGEQGVPVIHQWLEDQNRLDRIVIDECHVVLDSRDEFRAKIASIDDHPVPHCHVDGDIVIEQQVKKWI
jgi:hypothetical protein